MKNIIADYMSQLKLAAKGKRFKAVIYTGIFCAFVAYGMFIFNHYAIGDNTTSMLQVGATITSGRWFLHLAGRVVYYLFGGNFALPLISWLLSISYLVLSSYLVINLLDIKKLTSCILISSVMVMFPGMVSLSFFTFTAS